MIRWILHNKDIFKNGKQLGGQIHERGTDIEFYIGMEKENEIGDIG